MAAIETALVALLTANSNLVAQVSDRLFPVVIPEKTDLPALVYHKYATARTYAAEGSIALVTANFQITVWAETYAAAGAAGDLVRAATNNYTGTIGGVAIDHIEILDEGDIPSLAGKAESLNRYGRYVDLKIFYSE